LMCWRSCWRITTFFFLGCIQPARSLSSITRAIFRRNGGGSDET
jgi:hypothetical protein